MNFIDFNKLLKDRELKSLYLFKGSEEYLMNKYLDNVRKAYVDDSLKMLNYIEIDVNGSFDDILNSCETIPFMSSRKLIVIKDIYEMIQNDRSISDKLNDYLPDLPDTSILIIKDKDDRLKKNTKLYKTINRMRAVVEFDRLSGPQLKYWIKGILSRNKKTIDGGNLNYLVDRSNYLAYRSEKSLFELENELLKIINHSQEESISREDIDSNLLVDIDTNIFNLIDAIMRRQAEEALLIFNNMYRMNEPVARILFMLIRHFRLLMKYDSLSRQNYSNSDIMREMKISSFEFKKIARNARSLSEAYMRKGLNYLLLMDKKQKTSSQDEKLAMEILIVNLTRLF